MYVYVVFVNSTNITTNIETAVLSTLRQSDCILFVDSLSFPLFRSICSTNEGSVTKRSTAYRDHFVSFFLFPWLKNILFRIVTSWKTKSLPSPFSDNIWARANDLRQTNFKQTCTHVTFLNCRKKVKFWNCASYVTYLMHCWWISREENVNKAILHGHMVRQDDVNQIKRYKMVLARVLARLVARQKWISDAVVSSAARLSYISLFWAVSFPLSQTISITNETRRTIVKLQRSAFVFVRSVWSASYLTRFCICKAQTQSSANESLRWTKVKRSVLPQRVFHQAQPVVSSCGCGQIKKGGQAAKSENHS